MKQFQSKRFLAFVVSVVLFVVLVFLTSFAPLEIASSISIITGIYIGAETIKKSGSEII
jgi:uncharacterized membrane-anchored protein